MAYVAYYDVLSKLVASARYQHQTAVLCNKITTTAVHLTQQ
jgi:hypothetical protein